VVPDLVRDNGGGGKVANALQLVAKEGVIQIDNLILSTVEGAGTWPAGAGRTTRE
jgi:hypothetical protein